MNVDEILATSINHSTLEVFSTMMGTELPAGEVSSEAGSPDTLEGVISFIGVAGSWTGTGSLMCSPALACCLCSKFLMTEADTVNEEVLDAIAELTNMIIGNVKTTLENLVGSMLLSTPTVIYGRNFQTRSARNQEWTVVPFEWDGERMCVQVCIAPNTDAATSAVRPGFPVPHMLNV